MFVKVLVPLVVLGGVVFVLFSFLGAMKDRPTTTPSTIARISQQSAASIYERDMGTVPNPIASTWQGTNLLSMLREQRPERVVRLTATDQVSGQQVRLTVDLNQQTITRQKTRSDGHGTSEVWTGDVMHRLESAASGNGSFNHTPTGMREGTYTTF